MSETNYILSLMGNSDMQKTLKKEVYTDIRYYSVDNNIKWQNITGYQYSLAVNFSNNANNSVNTTSKMDFQLEKINMLDYADVICINKFDKAGALDALHDVRKQFKRRRPSSTRCPCPSSSWRWPSYPPSRGDSPLVTDDSAGSELQRPIVDPAEVAAFLRGLPLAMDPGFTRFVLGFPRKYLAETPRAEVVKHYALAGSLGAKPVISSLARTGGSGGTGESPPAQGALEALGHHPRPPLPVRAHRGRAQLLRNGHRRGPRRSPTRAPWCWTRSGSATRRVASKCATSRADATQ